MTTFDQVIDDLYRTEEPVYCIFSNLGTKRCLVEISREQLESTPPLLSLVTESDYDIQRLDGRFFSRLLCTEHQNMDVIQGIIQNWLWDQDAMRLSMPGNETPMDSHKIAVESNEVSKISAWQSCVATTVYGTKGWDKYLGHPQQRAWARGVFMLPAGSR